MELRRAAEDGEELDALKRGWCVGSEEFRKELLAQMSTGPEHFGQEIRESGEQKAQRRIAEELKKLRWTSADLVKRAKGDPEKVRVARLLRQETTMKGSVLSIVLFELDLVSYPVLAPMARKVRVQYPGAIYHVMNRGDHREPIFSSNKDRELFLKTLGEASEKTDWQVHAWCLMSNHLHLVIETPRANLVAGMKWLLG